MSARSAPAAWLLRLPARPRRDLDPSGRIAGGEGIDRRNQHPVAGLQRRLVLRASGFFMPVRSFSGSRGNHRQASCWIGFGLLQGNPPPAWAFHESSGAGFAGKFPTGRNQLIKPGLYCLIRPLALSGPAAKHSPSPSVFAAAFFFPASPRFVTMPRPSSARRQGHRAPPPRGRRTASAWHDRKYAR